MSLVRASELIAETSKEIVKDNPKYAAAINKAGPTAIGAAVTAVTGSHDLGTGASIAAGAVAGAEPNFFSETVTSFGITMVAQAGAIVLAPVVVVWGIAEGLKALFGDD